jgi:hypothetical protein
MSKSRRSGALSVLDAARHVQSKGRAGDDYLVHVNKDELVQMHEMWGEPSINPLTGLLEYGFFSKLKKAVKNIGKSIVKTATPWTINKQDIEDIKHGKGLAGVGTPLHGLTAANSAHKALSPTYHIKERIGRLRDGENFLSKEHLTGTRDDFHHYLQDGVKENAIPLAIIASAGLGAAGAGASTAGGTGAGTGAGTAGGLGALTSAAPAGVETVTVLGSGAGGSGGLSALGGVAGAAVPALANSMNQPVENVTTTASRLPPGVSAEDLAAIAAATGSAVGAPADPTIGTQPAKDPASLPENVWNYIKNPDNWEQIIQGVGTVGSLYQQYAGGGGGGAAPVPGNPGTHHDISLQGRRFIDPRLDYSNYGAGPEASFYENVTTPLKRGGHVRRGALGCLR